MRVSFFMWALAGILTAGQATGQITLTGKLVDSVSLQPIAFANLTLADGRTGTTTEIEGNFALTIPAEYAGPIYLSHVSYQRRTVSPAYLQAHAISYLRPASTALREVEVTATALENPAFAIIRQAVAHKRDNDPRSLRSYSLISYNKFLITMSAPTRKDDSLMLGLKAKKDTAALNSSQKGFLKFDSLLQTSHLFFSESVTEKQVMPPDREKEKLLALQVSGFKSPLFTNLATDYQPFSFYRDNISLLQKDFINPISKGTFSRYDFYLRDTTYFGRDTVFVIQFKPKAGTRFNGLTGMVSICTDGYAIKNIIATSADPQMITRIRIQQNYDKIDGHWFPVQLNTDLDFLNLKFGSRHFIAQQRSTFHDIKINPSLSARSFGDITTELTLPPAHESKKVLAGIRRQDLSAKEQRTYTLLDSVMRKLAWIDRIMEALVVQAVPWGPVELDLNRVALFNNYERVRLGAGIYTSSAFSKRLRLGGYAGYGLHDQRWKYGGEMRYNFNLNKDFFLRLNYSNDLRETGSAVAGNGFIRSLVASRYDREESWSAAVGYRIFPDVHAAVFVARNTLTPTYAYQLQFDNQWVNRFQIAETGLSLRYVKQERYLSLNGKKIFLSSRFPLVVFSVTQALPAWQAMNFRYTAFRLDARQLFKHRYGGKTYLYLSAGQVNGLAPYGKLYNGRGASLSSLYTDDFFQTMGLYEFTASRYVSLFAHHNLGNIFLNTKFSKPELVLYHHIGVGHLDHGSAQTGLNLLPFDKGYVESGLGIDNLLRYKYANIAYYGVGAGVFYRYGPYQLPNSSDNVFLKMTLSFTF